METIGTTNPAQGMIGVSEASSTTRTFWITWLGWMLDSFDLGIYIFILIPALSELLTLEGIAVTRGAVAQYGGYLFSIFMLGWACSMFWGWMADRIGRVRVMCLTILVYSVFTALCGLAVGLLSFAVFRFFAGFGVGGEWAAGTRCCRRPWMRRTACGLRAGCIPRPRSAS